MHLDCCVIISQGCYLKHVIHSFFYVFDKKKTPSTAYFANLLL